MQSHEYRVVPSPRRAPRVKGLRRPEQRFAHGVEAEMNRMAAEGWEFVRSDTLPCERKSGWFSRPVTVFETVLVFRRPQPARAAAPAMPPPVALAPPVTEAPRPAPAASRFTPPPVPARPANSPPPPAPALAEPEPAAEEPKPRHAAE